MRRHDERGFTLLEFLVLFSALLLVSDTVADRYLKARDAARIAEVKSNVHLIQVQLERYAADHSGGYPKYILGGDVVGWDEKSGCRALTQPNTEDLKPPRDPLVHYAYLWGYPSNPFLDRSSAASTIISWTSRSTTPGNGDVRFGFYGDTMGNCLDDPMHLFIEPGQPSRLQYTMIPVPESDIGVFTKKFNSFYCMGGVPPWPKEAGGLSDPDGKTMHAFWPGQFFYRAGGDFFIANPQNVSGASFEHIWGWPYMRYNKYILGGYGSLQTDGLDVIRLTTKESQIGCLQPSAAKGSIEGQFYQDHSDPNSPASFPRYDVQVAYSNPEVFGGGARGLMPQFPYLGGSNSNWIFGAPDGYPDGVVLVLTNAEPEPFAEQ